MGLVGLGMLVSQDIDDAYWNQGLDARDDCGYLRLDVRSGVGDERMLAADGGFVDSDAGGCAAEGYGRGPAADGADSAALEGALSGGEESDGVGEPLRDSAGWNGHSACDDGGCEYQRAGRGWNAAAYGRSAA